MEEYKVRISTLAYKDLERILLYINDNLQESERAEKTYKTIISEINKLQYFPKRHPILELKEDQFNQNIMLVIGKYIAFYTVGTNEKIVIIRRILRGNSNWEQNL